MRKFRLVLCPLLLFLAFTGPGEVRSAEGESEYFSYHYLEFSGAGHDRVMEDVNGDGLLDLSMVFSRSDVRDAYWLKTCLQKKGGGFASDCSDLRLPGEVRTFDIGQLDGRGGAELVIVTARDIRFASFGGSSFGSFQALPSLDTVLNDTAPGEPLLSRTLWDLDGDGKKELIVSTEAGPRVYSYDEQGLELLHSLSSPAHITYRVGSIGDIKATDDINQFLLFRDYQMRKTVKVTVPDVFITDMNGDGRLDIVTLVDNTLRVFPRSKDGGYPKEPVLKLKKSILPPEEKGSGFAGEGMTFSDLNGDGVGDVIMMKWGASQERTQMDRYLYYARDGMKYPEEPDQIIRSESAAINFGIADLDNNGKQDLIIPFFHFAPAQAFKVITENSIKVQFRIFLMGPDGRYSQDPGKDFARVDRRVLLDYRIDILGMIFDIRTLLEGKFSPLISFTHEFNGDGYGDIIADTGRDKLEFYWGDKDANYSRRADHAIDFESAMDFNLKDVNGDGKTDVIAFYESEEKTKRKRELAAKARERETPIGGLHDAKLEDAPEGTRVKILLSK